MSAGGGAVDVIFGQALPDSWHFVVLLISTAGQLFCATACLTSASRMTYAFARDGAVPGSSLWAKVSPTRKVPVNAVLLVAVVGAVITLPALWGVGGIPLAFYAITSVAVIGLYLAFAIPIFLRWRAGDSFETGQWTLGKHYKWLNLVAVAEIAIISVYFVLPFVPSGWITSEDFSWASVNYAPILTVGSLVLLALWWRLSARRWFKGPKTTLDSPDTTGSDAVRR